MLKKILVLAIIAVIAPCLVGGCDGGVEDYGGLLAENQRLLIENQNLSAALMPATADAKLTGAFVATVRHIIPDYIFDNVTPQIAILTQYQSGPFMLFMDETIIAKLEVGQIYYFEIEDTPVGEMLESEMGYYNLGCDVNPPFNIKSVRAPEEDEIGVSSPNVTYQKNN